MNWWSRQSFRLLKWQDWRMEVKMFVVFLFLLVLPIGVITQLAAERYSSSIEENTITFSSQVADKMLSNLDTYMEDMKKISLIPSYLDQIQTGLQISNRFSKEQSAGAPQIADNGIGEGAPGGVISQVERKRLEIQQQIGNSIYFITNIKKGTNTVYLFDLYGTTYYAMRSGTIRSDLADVYERWKTIAEHASGRPVLISTQEVSDVINRKRFVFTVVRQIIDTSYSPVGMIAIDVNMNVIEDIVKDLDHATEGTTLIVDGENRVIYDSKQQYMSQSLDERSILPKESGQEGSFHTTVNGEKELIIYRESAETGWRVIISIPQKKLMEDAELTRNYTLIAGIATVIFAMLISIILIYALNRPLRSLIRMMKEVQGGNLSVTFPVRRRDEAGQVGTAFNRMIQRVSLLIEEVQTIERRKQEVELESLQRQINPHFIYNTQESLRMTGVLNDDGEVADMSRLLGKLLRYSIHSEVETVPIAKEWEHLTQYVQLLNYRYGNRFQLILPKEELSDVRVLKLLFQPIVENSIHHGQDKENSRMDIVIDYRAEGTDQIFTVSDTGIGMDEDTLRALQDSLNHRDVLQGSDGIGLRNVNDRIKLHHGSAYGISVASKPGEGTVVTVRLPI